MKSLKSFGMKAAEGRRTPRRARDIPVRSMGACDPINASGCLPPPGFGVRQSSAAFARGAESGLTLFEVIVIIGTVVILFLLVAPFNCSHGKAKAVRIKCVSNLKRVALAFRVWDEDRGDHFPMGVYTNKSGSPLYATSSDMFRSFQVMSNELSNPQILVCPADGERRAATNFTTDFDSSHISYFLGLVADETNPNSFLAGDSNITNGFAARNGLLELTTNQSIGWTSERHHNAGNVAMADGSVQQFNSVQLNDALKNTGLATNRLLIPDKPSVK